MNIETVDQVRSIPTHKVATTKEIKKYLQTKFNYPFSVTQGKGTARHWINIRWTDGPTGEEVRNTCGKFNDTEHDDHMTDLWCGSQYTSESRTISAKAFIYAAWQYCKDWGYKLPKITIRKSYDGTYDAWIENADDIKFDQLREGSSWYLSHAISHLTSKIDYRKVFRNQEK